MLTATLLGEFMIILIVIVILLCVLGYIELKYIGELRQEMQLMQYDIEILCKASLFIDAQEAHTLKEVQEAKARKDGKCV